MVDFDYSCCLEDQALNIQLDFSKLRMYPPNKSIVPSSPALVAKFIIFGKTEIWQFLEATLYISSHER